MSVARVLTGDAGMSTVTYMTNTTSTSRPFRSVRLWWRCTLCRYRFDTFGGNSGDIDLHRAAWEALDHLSAAHGLLPDRITDAAELIRPDGATTRVVRHSLIVDR